MKGLSKYQGLTLFLVILFITVVVLTAAWLDSPYPFDTDSGFYIDLAEGRISTVIKPFTTRVLHPWLVGTIARAFQLETDLAFLSVGVLSLVILITTVTLIARSTLPDILIPALLATPFLVGLFQDYYLPDLFHAALLGTFFLCLHYKKHWISLVVLFLLQITRESTSLLVLIYALLLFMRGQWKVGLGSMAAAALGMTVTNHYASLGGTNIHQMNDLLYLAAKVPYNFFKNTLGLVFWTDTFAVSNPAKFPAQPLWQIPLPGWVPGGAIRAVGFYTFDPSYPLISANFLLTSFGVLPTLVLADLARIRRRLFTESELYVSVALLYGLASFLIGTSLGASVGRLIGYGWPCFWIALPCLLRQHHPVDRQFYLGFFSIHLLAAWLPSLIALISSRSPYLSLPALCLSLLFHGLALRLIIQSRVDR